MQCSWHKSQPTPGGQEGGASSHHKLPGIIWKVTKATEIALTLQCAHLSPTVGPAPWWLKRPWGLHSEVSFRWLWLKWLEDHTLRDTVSPPCLGTVIQTTDNKRKRQVKCLRGCRRKPTGTSLNASSHQSQLPDAREKGLFVCLFVFENLLSYLTLLWWFFYF
jgi:hypothetical protein